MTNCAYPACTCSPVGCVTGLADGTRDAYTCELCGASVLYGALHVCPAEATDPEIDDRPQPPEDGCQYPSCDCNDVGPCDASRVHPKRDPVNHPAHYTAGAVECIDAIESALGDGFADYCRGQVLKYLWRAGKKDDAMEDAKKAEWYLKRLIQTMENS